MTNRMINWATLGTGLAFITLVIGYGFGPSPQLVPSPEWVSTMRLPSAIIGGTIGAIFIILLKIRIDRGIVQTEQLNGPKLILMFVFITMLGGYAASRTIVIYSAKVLVGTGDDRQMITSTIWYRYYSSRTNDEGWQLAYGHRLPVALPYILNCPTLGAKITMMGQGNAYGLLVDRIVVTDQNYDDQITLDFVDGTGTVPARCGPNQTD